MSTRGQNRPTRPETPAAAGEARHRGLMLEEPLIFERGDTARSGVDLPAPDGMAAPRLGGLAPRAEIGLPGLSEPETMRHYTRLSQKNYAIDSGIFPLGSCTMKHNPRFNERMARLPGFADIHPLQPPSTVPGALAVMAELSDWLLKLTGMAAVALSPGAGAHGEFCGMAAIRSALRARGEADSRVKVLVPDSAHGTNPATAAALGFEVVTLDSADDGCVPISEVRAALAGLEGQVAGIMLTNPNTCGLFERDIRAIADAVHEAGGYFYCDGANFNAILGRAKPADLGIDAMHLNLHKTFSTPHGGGGPGAGPVVFSAALAPYQPVPYMHRGEDGRVALVEHGEEGGASLGRLKGFHGQFGMFTRALCYMLSHGGDGLRQVSGDAVLAANYIRASLNDVFSAPFPGICMHECLFDERFLKDSGVSTLDFAKAMIDAGVHPMTIYFPLIVKGAMLIEPTETESKASLDGFIALMRRLAEQALSGDAEAFKQAPRHAPRRRLDETAAARNPVLRWRGDNSAG